jgi:hypothetical protein
MKTTYTIATIAMFAFVLGMSSISPAMAKADTPICHYAETVFEIDPETNEMVLDDNDNPIVLEEAVWKVITVNNKGAANGHVERHGPVDDESLRDFEIDETPDSGLTSTDCTNRNPSE